jgi:hypothetical protein
MGEMAFNPFGLNANSFQSYGVSSGQSNNAGQPVGGGFTSGTLPNDEVSINNSRLFDATGTHGVAALNNPWQRIRLAVAQDPRGGSLNPSTLDLLHNPPHDESGFGI